MVDLYSNWRVSAAKVSLTFFPTEELAELPFCTYISLEYPDVIGDNDFANEGGLTAC